MTEFEIGETEIRIGDLVVHCRADTVAVVTSGGCAVLDIQEARQLAEWLGEAVAQRGQPVARAEV